MKIGTLLFAFLISISAPTIAFSEEPGGQPDPKADQKCSTNSENQCVRQFIGGSCTDRFGQFGNCMNRGDVEGKRGADGDWLCFCGYGE